MLSYKKKIKKVILDTKKKLAGGKDPIETLSGLFKNQTILLISAGPSAENWEKIYEQEKHNCPIIVCIKQSINVVGDLCDIHFLNNWNLLKYNPLESTLTIMTEDNSVPCFGNYDIIFKMDKSLVEPNLATVGNYEDFLLNKSGIKRPIGPGIMHETVLHTLVHMGFKRIVTIGWDIADENGLNSHFDGKINSKTSNISYNKFRLLINRDFRKYTSLIIKKYISYFYNLSSYNKKKLINKAMMKEGEAELVASSIIKIKDWLSQKKISIDIKGNSKWSSGQVQSHTPLHR